MAVTPLTPLPRRPFFLPRRARAQTAICRIDHDHGRMRSLFAETRLPKPVCHAANRGISILLKPAIVAHAWVKNDAAAQTARRHSAVIVSARLSSSHWPALASAGGTAKFRRAAAL